MAHTFAKELFHLCCFSVRFFLKLKISHQECAWHWDSCTLVHRNLYHQPAHKIVLRIMENKEIWCKAQWIQKLICAVQIQKEKKLLFFWQQVVWTTCLLRKQLTASLFLSFVGGYFLSPLITWDHFHYPVCVTGEIIFLD